MGQGKTKKRGFARKPSSKPRPKRQVDENLPALFSSLQVESSTSSTDVVTLAPPAPSYPETPQSPAHADVLPPTLDRPPLTPRQDVVSLASPPTCLDEPEPAIYPHLLWYHRGTPVALARTQYLCADAEASAHAAVRAAHPSFTYVPSTWERVRRAGAAGADARRFICCFSFAQIHGLGAVVALVDPRRPVRLAQHHQYLFQAYAVPPYALERLPPGARHAVGVMRTRRDNLRGGETTVDAWMCYFELCDYTPPPPGPC